MNLGAHLKKAREGLKRESKAYSLRKVAKRVGVTPGFLSQVENGTASPSEAVLVRLAEDLGLNLDVLAAMDGKLSPKFRKAVALRPELFAELISAVESLPDEAVLRLVREVKDGDW